MASLIDLHQNPNTWKYRLNAHIVLKNGKT